MKSYLKFLSRNKLYTAIEAVGLIVSLAFVILIGTSIRDQLGIVKSVPGHERLFLAGPNGTGGEYRTQEELAQRLGKSRSMVANSLRLLQLPQAALESLEEGAISAGHARSLLALAPDGDAMAGFLARMLAYKLSVRDCEDAVAHWKKQGRLPWSDGGEAPKKAPARRRKSPEFKQLEKSLGTLLKVKTSLSGTPAKGRISLSYASEDELMRLLGLLGLKDVKEAAAEGQDSEAE